jgi:hypothetical protein
MALNQCKHRDFYATDPGGSMRFRNATVAAACVLAAGLAIGGYEASRSSGPASGPAANASPSVPAGSASPAAASSGTHTGAAHGTCQPGNLTFALGAKTKASGSQSQTTQAVDLTNKGSSACTMDGFPGVDLVGVARGQQHYSWSLARRSGAHSKVRLRPGGTAHFDVTYLPISPGNINSITVTKMVITPPNGGTRAELTWSPFMLLQDKATHAGTYISPIVPGS